MPDARGVGDGDGGYWWERSPVTRRDSGRKSCRNGCLSDTAPGREKIGFEEEATEGPEARDRRTADVQGLERCDHVVYPVFCMRRASTTGYTSVWFA